MALERYVRMRKEYEEELRREPKLDQSGSSRRYHDGDDERAQGDDTPLSIAQKVMMGVSALITVLAALFINGMPVWVTTWFFDITIRTSIRSSEILQWNMAFVILPFVILLLSFLVGRHSSALGLRMLLTSIAGSALLASVAGVFCYFVISVAA